MSDQNEKIYTQKKVIIPAILIVVFVIIPVLFLMLRSDTEPEPEWHEDTLFNLNMHVSGNGLNNVYYTNWWNFTTGDTIRSQINDYNDVTGAKMRMYFTEVPTSFASVGILIDGDGYKEYTITHDGRYRFEFRADEFNPFAKTPSISFHFIVTRLWFG